MSFYEEKILPRLILRTCAVGPVNKQRAKVVPLARGRVLEVGAGGGLNLPFYDMEQVDEVLGLDISAQLLSEAGKAAAAQDVPFSPVLLDAAALALPDASIDTVLVTYSLCSIDDLAGALAEMRRVLKPDGMLIFCEHGRAPDAGVALVQDVLTPAWRRVAGGCRLNRDPAEEIRRAGFEIESLDTMYLPGVWRLLGWNEWGVARPV